MFKPLVYINKIAYICTLIKIVTNMYNRELQRIDTQEKAYLLGLFYADGNIGINQTQCRVALKLEDRDLIFHLQKLFPFFYVHYDRGTKIELGNYQKALKEDLIIHGCLPRKSFENKENIHMPNINNLLIRHFIRGYFDGDGGCTLSYPRGKTQKRVYIYSVSIQFLEEVRVELENNNIISEVFVTNNIGKLTIITSSYTHFYNYLYKGVNLVKFYLQLSLHKRTLFPVNFVTLMIQFVMVIIIIK